MKIRNVFVSNSSSSSFLIYGISTYKVNLSAFNEDDIYDDIEEKLGNLENVDKRVDLKYGPDDDYYYIGASWDSVRDDETGLQFKNSVEESIKQLFPDQELKFGTCCECWRDG